MHNTIGCHYSDVIMGALASQITSITIVYSTVYLGAHQRKYESSASLAFVRGIHRSPVNSPHKGPVTRKCFHLMTSSWFSNITINQVCSILFKQRFVNSLRPSDAIRRKRSLSALVQVMDCYTPGLAAPSHFQNHCWFIISKAFVIHTWGRQEPVNISVTMRWLKISPLQLETHAS